MKGHAQFLALGRAASRALPSTLSSIASEALAAWGISWRQDCRRQLSSHRSASGVDCNPSTSSNAEGQPSVGIALGHQRSFLDAASHGSKVQTTVPLAGSAAAAASWARPPLLPRDLRPAPPTVAGLRAFHMCASTAAPAAGDDGGGNSGPGASSSSSQLPAGTSTAPVQNPLQAALAAASGTQPPAGPGLKGRAAKGRRRERRTWLWYDEDDERQERRYERAREQFTHVGTAYMSNITQSVKKMNRIVRLVRGLSYADAVAQCRMVPHKAARLVLQALEAAYQDATQAVGLEGDKLVVGLIYATRGRVEKAMQRMGRGRSGRMFTRTSHLRVVLRESRERPSSGFQMRTVAPLMGIITGAAAPAASWLTRGPTAAVSAAQRPRFAYRVEV